MNLVRKLWVYDKSPESYNSLIALRNGTLFVTNSNNQFRSFRIVGGNMTPKYFSVNTY
ncbi:hypothetical protein EWB00_005577, partial [Schistosoma japonicum]